MTFDVEYRTPRYIQLQGKVQCVLHGGPWRAVLWLPAEKAKIGTEVPNNIGKEPQRWVVAEAYP
jgi:hypothetical protein